MAQLSDNYVHVKYYNDGINPFQKFISSEHFISTETSTYIDYKGWLYKVEVVEYSRQIPTEQTVYCLMPTYTVVAEEVTGKFPYLSWQTTNKTDVWFSYSILKTAIEARHSTFKDFYK